MKDPLMTLFHEDPMERREAGMSPLTWDTIRDMCDDAWSNGDYALLEQIAACSRRYPDSWKIATCATRVVSDGQMLFAIPVMLAPGSDADRVESLRIITQILSTFIDPRHPTDPVTWQVCDWEDFPASLSDQREWLAGRRSQLPDSSRPTVSGVRRSDGMLLIGCGAGMPDLETSIALVQSLARAVSAFRPVRVGTLHTPWMARRDVQMMQAVAPAWLAMVARKQAGYDLMIDCLQSKPVGDERELTLEDPEGNTVFSFRVPAVDGVPAEQVALSALGAYGQLIIDQPVRRDVASRWRVDFAISALTSELPENISEGQRFVRRLATRGYQADLEAIATQLGNKGLSLRTLVPGLFN